MARVPLVFAGCDTDRSRPLIDGTVQPDGIDLNYLVVDAGDLFRRMCKYAEFEAAEMSTSSYMAMITRGDDRLIGVPIFPSRTFRHRCIFINTDAGIDRPEDLAGRRMGFPEYQMTAAVWMRAILHHDYGVKPTDVEWVEGGFERPGFSERMALDLPPGIRNSVIPQDKSLVGMLIAGEIDALGSGHVPAALLDGHPKLRRLFTNYAEVEMAYYRRTKFFPIMHMVAIRREIYERHRWIPNALLDAFNRAKALTWRQIQQSGWLPLSLPWLRDELDDIAELFGGHPFTYGFEPNYATLQALTQYSYEQGLSKRKLEPEELFAPETLAAPANTAPANSSPPSLV